MRYVSAILLLLLSYGCSELGSYDYLPNNNIGFSIILKKADYLQEHEAIFLYFHLRIHNDNSEEVFFNPGQLQVKVNGILSKETYYDSLASVMPEKEALTKGESNFNLYFVLPEMKTLKSIDSFEVIAFGLESAGDSN